MSLIKELFQKMQNPIAINEVIKDDKGEIKDFNIIEVNKAFEKYMKEISYDLTLNKGKEHFSLLLQDKQLIKYVLLSKRSQYVEVELKTHYKFLGLDIIPLSEVKFALIITNKTKEKKFERKIIEETEKYRNVVDNLSIAVLIHNNNEILFVNNSCVKILRGNSENDFVQRDFWEFVHQDYQESLKQKLLKVLEKEKKFELIEVKFVKIDSKTIWVRLNATMILFQNQNAVQITFQDISELIKTKKEMKKTSELLSNIFYASPNPIAVINKSRILIDCNPSFLELLELESKKELFSKDLFDFFLGEERKKAEKNLVLLMKGKGKLNNPYWIKTAKGKKKYVEISSSLLKDKFGNYIGIMSIIFDITEREKIQKAVLQAQKLESLGVMAGGVAHDFNNFMMAVLGNADIALMEIDKLSPVIPYIEDIKKIAVNASAISNQMIAYSGKAEITIKSLNISNLILEILSLIKLTISNKITLNLHINKNIPLINCDEAQLKQIIMNLVLNASEALKNKPGTIKIETGFSYFSYNNLIKTYIHDEIIEGEYVFFKIEDNGCGMDESTLKRIFDPFFTTKFTGRGLGLAAVLGIVKSHKGYLITQSSKGKGSSFKIIFPISNKKPEKTKINEKKMQNLTWTKDKGILLVDDEPQIIKVGSIMLKKLGFEVFTALNGKEALSQFKSHGEKIMCALLDITMPVMDGEETFLRLIEMDLDVKVIFTSGYSEQDVTEKMRTKNYVGFIQKPYTFSDLKNKLQILLN